MKYDDKGGGFKTHKGGVPIFKNHKGGFSIFGFFSDNFFILEPA